ncbi:MAG TPA: nuclear transport factor 2 family protein, partial [Chitinophagaceae bacterium]|nr:nuclear transport factor 2 family protein [Chitinophagaceae bacterium]
MKLSKELEKEVRKEYIEYWDCYMKGDSRKISRFLDRNIKMMGTTEGEVFNNKKEAVNFFKTTAGEVAGKIAMRNRIIDIVPLQDLILINELMDLYVLSRGEWVFYSKVRLSSLMQQQKTGWKIIQQHGSMPDARTQEGETIAFERITKENLALRDAVNRRTVELENKSRALEIESSLERVRTVAMGMKAPEDMLDVCRVISTELQGLGIKEIRNVQTAIIDEEKASYLNYEYFRLHKKTCITTVEYKKQKDVNAFVKKMLKDHEGFFTKNFKGAELKDWMQYQAKAGQFVDPQLKKTNSLHYYFYSIGPGALGISAYAPLTKEAISLFKQFRNVFLLAYRRFLDIQKAVAQAREAKIEL